MQLLRGNRACQPQNAFGTFKFVTYKKQNSEGNFDLPLTCLKELR